MVLPDMSNLISNSGSGGLSIGDIGTATSSATAGAVTIGDKIIGKKGQMDIITALTVLSSIVIVIKFLKKRR